MEPTGRHDTWQAGESYDAYMGRWSRPVAARFLDWLDPLPGLDWLELGCGTGALTAAIVSRGAPVSVRAIAPPPGFVAHARALVHDPRVTFDTGDAAGLAALPAASVDIAVSALVLNFVPDRARALAELRRLVRRGGRVAFYVWDYPGSGLAFLRAFWTAATALDPAVADLREDRRFPFSTLEGLTALMAEAGIDEVRSTAIDLPAAFGDFDDYWRHFTPGAGPAPGYVASLEPAARERLRDRRDATLPRQPDRSIAPARVPDEFDGGPA